MVAYHPAKDTTVTSKDNFGYEPIQQLAKQLFSLPDRCEFMQVSTPLDPRGYLDLYGEDPEVRYQLEDEGKSITYHTLACFFDHISFILEDEIDCILTPRPAGIQFLIINERETEPVIEKLIHTKRDLVNVISGFLSVSGKTKGGEQ